MQNFAPAITPPAQKLKNALKRAKLAALTALFGCQHQNTDLPFDDQQSCKDCGAVRDYIFSLRWRKEYKDVLSQWQDGSLSPEQFAKNFHERLEASNAAFIGEWRNGIPREPAREVAPVRRCVECGWALDHSGRCPLVNSLRRVDIRSYMPSMEGGL
jgi:hypothetical protein